jgi:multiple sugar transport system permease protein
MLSLSRRKQITLLVSYVYLALILAFVLFPLFWMLSSSIKPVEDLFVIPPQWIPENPTLSTFRSVIFGEEGRGSLFPRYFLNSMIVTIGTTVVSLVVSTLAAYALSRYPFRGSNWLMIAILATQMFPQGLLLISLYVTFLRVQLLDTYYAMIAANTSFAIPFSIWMIKGFFDTIPRELEDAAFIDGCSRLGALLRIVLPVVTPGIIAATIYTFLIAWDEYLYAASLTLTPEMRPLPPGIVQSFVGQFYLNWPNVMGASTLMTIPVTLLFIFFQRYLVQGLSSGAVKL